MGLAALGVIRRQRVASVNWQRWLFPAASIVVLLLIVAREYSRLVYAQFWGDEVNWFANAYLNGAWRSLFMPAGGYLVVASKIPTLIQVHTSLIVGAHISQIYATLVQAFVCIFLLSKRFEGVAPFAGRAVFVCAYIAMPYGGAELIVVNNVQWHTGVLIVLLLVATEPATLAAKAVDFFLLALCSLTGPYCIVLLPLAVVFWWRSRERSILPVIVLAIGSAIQVYVLAHNLHACANTPILRANLLRAFAGQAILFGMFHGGKLLPDAGLHSPAATVMAVAVLAISGAFFWYVLKNTSDNRRLPILYGLAIGIAAVRRLHCDAGWNWDALLNPDFAIRYWYLPRLALVAALVWALGRQRPFAIRSISGLMLGMVFCSCLQHWEYPSWSNPAFIESANAFEKAKPGAAVIVNSMPPGWRVVLRKH